MTTRRPLGPGFDPGRQDVADPAPHRPGRTAAELAADAPVAVEPSARPTGRRPLLPLRPAPMPPPTTG